MVLFPTFALCLQSHFKALAQFTTQYVFPPLFYNSHLIHFFRPAACELCRSWQAYFFIYELRFTTPLIGLGSRVPFEHLLKKKIPILCSVCE